MFLTVDILEKYKACPEGVSWFLRHFPDGAELMEVMNTRHIPLSFLDWGFLHLPTSQEEKKYYCEIVKISEDSTDIFESHQVTNSHVVTNSKDVQNSSYTYFSEDVSNSHIISHGIRIKDSTYVSRSTAIFSSVNIINSTNIKNSNNISYSNYIINSHDIYKSTLLTNSAFCLFSSNLQDCVFCSHMSNSNHCLFCYDMIDAQYCVFNKQIDKTTWEFIYEEFLDIFENVHLNLFTPWIKEDPNAIVTVNNNYQNMFIPIFGEKKYSNWVRNLPYYDDLLAYKITFSPELY